MEKNINSSNNIDLKELFPEESKVEKNVRDILSQYTKGIESIFETSKEDEQNYLLLIFNCPDSFRIKYQNLHKNLLNESLNLKLYAGQSKKQEVSLNNYNNSKITNFEDSIYMINLAEKNNKYIIMLNIIFEKFFGTNTYLLENLITYYFESKKNHEFEYEDFILIFCSIIKYYSGLDISLELNEKENYLMIYICGNDDSYSNICKMLNYNLQLNPIAIDYEENHGIIKKKESNIDNNIKAIELIDYDDKEPLLQSFNSNMKNKNLQFEDYDINNPIFWPPFYSYKPEKDEKFRLYESNDDYFYYKKGSNKDIDINDRYYSKFRNIDKLRFIQRILNQIIKFSELKKLEIFEMMLYKKNNKSYSDKLKELNWKNIYNPFDYQVCNKTINTIRNYFGESVSYYFLWLDHYSRMLLFPSIFGSFIFISYFLWNKIPLISIFSNSVKMDYYDFLLILNCTLLTIWLTLFIKSWAQKEKLYNYIWGMNQSQKETKINEEFVPNSKEKLILGYYVPTEKEPFHTFKKYVSYSVLLGMIILVIFFIYSLFRLKARLVNGNVWHDYKISFYIACLNGLQIKVMNFIYYHIALYLNNWENHFTINEKNNSLSLKLILFDFMNSYSSLFYIAFVKPYNEGCINNNCPKELETQMYSIFLVYLCIFIGEILYLYMIYYYQKGKVGSLIREEKIEIQGLEHQIMMIPTDNINLEFNDIINQFGFACLFSIAAPLTPLIIFLLALVYRLTNYYKFIHLKRVENLDESKGISFYNKIIKAFLFIGVMVNVSIFLFSNHNASGIVNTIETIKNKFLTIFIVENTVLIIYFYVDRNILPNWFKYKDIIKDLYLNKYFYKNEKKKKIHIN